RRAEPRLRPRAAGGHRRLSGEAQARLAPVPGGAGPRARAMTARAPDGLRPPIRRALERATGGERLTDAECLVLADVRRAEAPALWASAQAVRDRGRPAVTTYSRKVFIPLTNLCRDVCSYCTFARSEDDPRAHTMSPDEVLQVAEAGARVGCKEALFCPGDRPEARWPRHPEALRRLRHATTHRYLAGMCRRAPPGRGVPPPP